MEESIEELKIEEPVEEPTEGPAEAPVAFVSPKDWHAEMIALEATPTELRKLNVTEFCKAHDISKTDYYRHRNLPRNQRAILSASLSYAKEYTSDVLITLAKQAKAGNTKSIELYLKFVLELTEKLKLGEDPDNPFRTLLTDKEKTEIDKIYATLVEAKNRSSKAGV